MGDFIPEMWDNLILPEENEVLGMRSERLEPYVKNKTDTDENPKCNLLEIQ